MMSNGDDLFVYGGEYRSLKGITICEVVKDWFEGNRYLVCDHDLSKDAPEIVWAAILEILQRDLTAEQEALLAAGPLEDLLSSHGSVLIDRVEQQAKQNPRFNHLLGGVWQLEMTPEIWERVQRVRAEVW